MTSIPERQENLFRCLESVLNQTLIPYKFILYFQGTKDDIFIKEILNFEEEYEHFEIRYINSKYRSYSKFYYAMLEYGDTHDILILDDDIILSNRFLEMFYTEKNKDKSNDTAYAYSMNKIDYNEKYKIIFRIHKLTYTDTSIKSRILLFNSGHGTLFPKGYFNKKWFNSNIDYLIKLFYSSDELGLFFHHLMFNKSTQGVEYLDKLGIIKYMSSDNKLFNLNVSKYKLFYLVLNEELKKLKFDYKAYEKMYNEENSRKDLILV